ncbi:MAG: hypothetical protein KAQ97_05535, partial [Candidatus Fermentibacteraceae bacterium]|nr:hypothetical protein [Candidatus Fermentibacteraceae bacterium]
TILLDIDPEEGFRRLMRQGRKRDRIELEDIAFHRRVRRMYLDLAESEDRFFVVDAMLNPAQQDEIILSKVISLISE